MRNFLTAMSILIIGGFLSYAIGTMKPKPQKLPESEPPALQTSAIKAAPLSTAVQIKTHGTVEASQSIDIISEVNGRVLSVHKNFINGGQIKRRETIIRIDDTFYQTELANAEADVASADELLSTEKARATQAKKEWRDLGSEEANALFLRKPQLKSAETRLKTAKARLAHAKQQLERTRIRLPYEATLTETHIHEGQYVTLGSKLASAYRTNRRQVKLQLSKSQLATANISWPIDEAKDIKIIITEPYSPNIKTEAQVISSGGKIDAMNQLIDVIVGLPQDSAKYFLPGLYVEALISGKPQDQVLRLPEDAFHDKRYILIADQDNKIRFIDAKFLSRDGDYVLLKADIEPGTTILSSRIPLATPGMKVSPQFENN